jgi:U3 small nucleolar ribonucleoprotein protein LCP5
MTDDTTAHQGLKDLLKKVEGTLTPAIEKHVGSSEFEAATDGLDFLDVKNSLLLSYLIDLVQHLAASNDDDNIQRLTEMKIALEKIRPLEKKMRYQLDKLLSNSNSSSTFATATSDPLSFRPNPEALKAEEEKSHDDGDDSNSDEDSQDGDDGNVDDDLAAARATLKLASERKGDDDDDDHNDGVYRAPRLASTPYPASDATNEDEKRKRFAKKARATELAKTLRDQYGDAPEQEDLHGGTDYGRQREASRKLDEQEKEKRKFEEDNMIRLTTSRKQKKERQRLMREESSNLSAISDLGSLTRSVSAAFDERPKRSAHYDESVVGQKKKKKYDGVQARNSLQKALYGGKSDGGDAKKKQKKRR